MTKSKGKIITRFSDMEASGRRTEFVCTHGIGHHNGVHGCDGCCADEPLMEKTTRDRVKPKEQDKMIIVTSPRIDWCGACKAEHGYDCPKDSMVQDWRNVFYEECCMNGIYGNDGISNYDITEKVVAFIEKVRTQSLEEQKEKFIKELEEIEIEDNVLKKYDLSRLLKSSV